MNVSVRNVLLIVVLLQFSLVAVAANGTQSHQCVKQDLDLVQPSKLTIGLTLAYAPFSYIEDGKPAGFDVTALRLVAEQLGLEPVFQNMKFSQVILSVKKEDIDITPGLYITPERDKVIDFVPYFSIGTSIVVSSSNSSPPKTKMDLCGLTVSSIKGAAVAGKVRNNLNPVCKQAGKKPVTILPFQTDPGATQAVLTGAADAQLTATIIADLMLKKTGGQLKISSDHPLYPVQVAWGVNESDDALTNALACALNQLVKSGRYRKLLDEYNLDPYDPEIASKIMQKVE